MPYLVRPSFLLRRPPELHMTGWILSQRVSDTKIVFMKSSATVLFVQQLFQAHNNENSKAPYYWALLRGIHQWLVDSPHKWPVILKLFSCDHGIMWEMIRSVLLWVPSLWATLNRPWHDTKVVCVDSFATSMDTHCRGELYIKIMKLEWKEWEIRARHISLSNSPGRVKVPVRQADLGKALQWSCISIMVSQSTGNWTVWYAAYEV